MDLFKEGAKNIFVYGSFYCVSLIATYALWVFIKNLRIVRFLFHRNKISYTVHLLLGFFFSVQLFLALPPKLRVLDDEANLAGVSMSLFYHRTATLPLSGYFDLNGALVTLEEQVPIRPLFYPYLTFLIHLFRGYDFHHAFWVNFGVLWLFLAGTAQWAYSLTRSFWFSFSVPLLLFSIPIFGSCATSGGFGLLHVAFLFLLLRFTGTVQRRPNRRHFEILLLLISLFIQIRYEGVLLSGVILIWLGFHRRFRESFLKGKTALWPLVVSVVLCLVQIWLSRGHYENPEGVSVLSFSNLFDNLNFAVSAFSDFSMASPYAPFLFFAGLVGSIDVTLGCLKRKAIPRDSLKKIVLPLMVVALNLFVFLAHHAGNAQEPVQARFFQGFFVGLLLLVFYWAAKRHLAGQWFFCVSTLFFVGMHPVTLQNRVLQNLLLPKEVDTILELLAPSHRDKTLLVAPRPGNYLIRKLNAVSFEWLQKNRLEVQKLKQEGKIDKVVVAKIIKTAVQKEAPGQQTPKDFKLRVFGQKQVDDRNAVALSEAEIPGPTARE